jgi:predicted metal-binding protein
MSEEIAVRSYRAPWKGQLLLVCRKCQRKLKHSGKKNGIAKLAKGLKKHSRLHVIQVPCLKMCPKGGVTVCTQGQLACGECSVVRTKKDVEALLSLAQHSITFSAKPASDVSL